MSPGKHGPNRLSNYLAVHNANMDQVVRGGFVSSDDLSLTVVDDDLLSLEGSIYCLGGIVIEVSKLISILDGTGARARVQTVRYSYNVKLAGVGNIFRYDSPDWPGEKARGHHLENHVHRYDVLGGDKVGTIGLIYDPEQVPTLREVIDEAAGWFYEHADQIVGLREGNRP